MLPTLRSVVSMVRGSAGVLQISKHNVLELRSPGFRDSGHGFK